MSRPKNIVVGVCIIIGGAVAALPFRKSADKVSPVRPPANRAANPERESDITLQLAPVSGTSPAWESSFRAEPNATDDVPTPTRVSLERLQSPPGLAPIFESFETAGDQSSQERDPQSERTHLVSDGDKLETLAERYLGNREKWGVIFRANADVLDSPELLPIGVEIVIPARDRRPGAEADGLVPVPQDLLHAAD